MFEFRRRIAILLLFLGAGLLSVHRLDLQHGPQTIIVAGLGLLVFYAGIYVMLLRRN